MNIEPATDDVSLKTMVFTRQFAVLYLANLFSIMSGFFAINNFKTYGQLRGITNDDYFAILGSVASVANCLRFAWSGATQD